MEHTALVYVMVLVSAADSDMTDRELFTMGEMVRILPVFRDFNPELLPQLAEDCAEILGQKNGLDAVIEVVAGSLPEHLRETAYALACDIAATDGRLNPEEIRLLEFLRHRLDVDRLTAAAIERGARARHATL
jgi:tellurite resistance protein